MVGSEILHYKIESKLGSGGMGEVYLATDTRLDRKVALKFLPDNLKHDSDARGRLLREARAASRLSHASITTIFAVEEDEGRDFIAMEFAEGETLSDLLQKAPLEFARALDIAIRCAQGLAAAHTAGVTHRDIKPANIIVNAAGFPKITDFGLATWRGAMTITKGGSLVGTPAYASPEQVHGREVDFRTDIWSLGVVLYEMIGGRHPFWADHEAALVYGIVHETPPPLSRLRPDVPRALERIVERCLSKNPETRFAAAQDVARDLRNVRNLLACDPGPDAGARATRERIPSIAVLPFANLSGNPDEDYLCLGIAEEITNSLTQIKGLQVASRTSAFAVGGQTQDIRRIGRELDVETVLEGSVQRAGRRLRVTSQLIKVEDGFHLWSDRFDREVDDVFAIQDEIATSIVKALRVVLTDEELRCLVRVTTTDVSAYDLYLRGRQFFHQGRKSSLHFAHQMFTRAIERDGTFALAYTALANTCSMLVHLYADDREANTAEADRASRTALELHPGLAESHAARGFALWLAGRLEEAWQEFETAIALDDRLFEARYFYGRARFQQGELHLAARLFEEACAIRDDWEGRYFVAQTHSALGDTERATESYRLAVTAVEQHIELNPDHARAMTMAAVAHCRLGNRDRGLEWAQRAVAVDPDDAGIQYNVACLYALEGEPDKAIDCLERAANAGFASRDWVEHDPDLESLRRHPRLVALPWRQ